MNMFNETPEQEALLNRLISNGYGWPNGVWEVARPKASVTYDQFEARGGWIVWRGGEQPVGDDVVVDTMYSDGVSSTQRSDMSDWERDIHDEVYVIAYRLHKSDRKKSDFAGAGTKCEKCGLWFRYYGCGCGKPEQPTAQGHPHHVLMAQYAEIAKTNPKPWLEFEYNDLGDWMPMEKSGYEWFLLNNQYRRKPKMKLIHGVEVPDISFAPKDGDLYWMPMPLSINMVDSAGWREYKEAAQHRSRNGLCYPHTEEGKQAAIAHAKAMLGITTESSRGGGREQNNEGDTVCV